PIVSVHVPSAGGVLDEPFAAAESKSPLQWLFDRTASSGAAERQLVSASLSSAAQDISLSVANLRERYLPALHRLLPRARSAEIVDFTATREPRATFRAAPESARLRPRTRTRIPGVYLAGAWT